MANIGSPLFILREECKNDLFAVLEKIARIGFGGVEFLSLFGNSVKEIKKRLDSLGISAVSDHVPFAECVSETDKVITERRELGCSYITIGPPDADGLPGGSNYARTVDSFNKIGEAAKKSGLRLLYHNHAAELENTVSGKTHLEHIMDDTDPDLLCLEPDLGWMGIGGANPMSYLKKYNRRCPVIHFKDYMPVKTGGFEFKPTGYGIMNNAELYEACLSFEQPPEWYILDHDCSYDRDPFGDLALSYEFFKNLTALVK